MAGRPPAYIGYSIRNHPQPSGSMHIRDNQPRPARHCPLHGFGLAVEDGQLAADVQLIRNLRGRLGRIHPQRD